MTRQFNFFPFATSGADRGVAGESLLMDDKMTAATRRKKYMRDSPSDGSLYLDGNQKGIMLLLFLQLPEINMQQKTWQFVSRFKEAMLLLDRNLLATDWFWVVSKMDCHLIPIPQLLSKSAPHQIREFCNLLNGSSLPFRPSNFRIKLFIVAFSPFPFFIESKNFFA